jgi:glutaminyl-peptide cyclotransferase
MKRVLISLALALCAICSCSAQVKRYNIKVEKTYPHDTQSYTQGLFFHGGTLYESTGLNGKSTLRTVDLESGAALQKLPFNKKYFVEGSVILGDRLYVLTWTNRVLFVYDAATLEYKMTYSYPREGWGLTTDGQNLIASDGSSHLYFLSEDLKLQKTLNVTLNGRAVRYLNELEWIDGRIWANVYTSDLIVIINPSTGKVEGIVNCGGLLPESKRTKDTDVLNGIAVDAQGRIYLTGKNWPELYRVGLVEAEE